MAAFQTVVIQATAENVLSAIRQTYTETERGLDRAIQRHGLVVLDAAKTEEEAEARIREGHVKGTSIQVVPVAGTALWVVGGRFQD